MKVIFNQMTKTYLGELIDILYNKHYFSIEENAREYVRSLVWEVETTLHLKQKREAPQYFFRYSNNLMYALFQKIKELHGISFLLTMKQNIYIIKYITYNHVSGHLLNEELF